MIHIFDHQRLRPTGFCRGDAFERYRSLSTHCEEWRTMHPDRGARSIGIGHPRSGDRCTEHQPTTSTPCGSPSTHLQCRRPTRGRGMMCTFIHRSSALRASTDAYGASILRMRESRLCSGLHMRSCPMTLRRSAGRALRQACSFFYPGDLGQIQKRHPCRQKLEGWVGVCKNGYLYGLMTYGGPG